MESETSWVPVSATNTEALAEHIWSELYESSYGPWKGNNALDEASKKHTRKVARIALEGMRNLR